MRFASALPHVSLPRLAAPAVAKRLTGWLGRAGSAVRRRATRKPRPVVARQATKEGAPAVFEVTKFGRRRKGRYSPRTKIVVGSVVGCVACAAGVFFFLL